MPQDSSKDEKKPSLADSLVSKVFPELSINDIVGVQPMKSSKGLDYALRYRYSSSRTEFKDFKDYFESEGEQRYKVHYDRVIKTKESK